MVCASSFSNWCHIGLSAAANLNTYIEQFINHIKQMSPSVVHNFQDNILLRVHVHEHDHDLVSWLFYKIYYEVQDPVWYIFQQYQ